MTLTFDQWKADVTGHTIGTGQCVALAQDYVNRCLGLQYTGTDAGAHPGYAIASWDAGGAPAGMTRHEGISGVQAGDVVFWNGFSPLTPFTMLSHVAVANGPNLGPMLPVVSQNSPLQVATQQSLPTMGIAGYWHPNSGGNGSNAKGAVWFPGDPLSQDDLNAAAGAVTGGAAAVNQIGTVLGGFGTLAAHLSDPKMWQRIGIFVLGAGLLLIAAVTIFSKSETVQTVQKISKGLSV